MNPVTWTTREDGTVVSSKVDYALSDAKGRKLGGFVVIELRHEYVTDDAGHPVLDWACRMVPDMSRLYYSARVYSTRDGTPFGAIPRQTRCVSLDAARTHGFKALAAAKKRYARLVAKAEGRQWARPVTP